MTRTWLSGWFRRTAVRGTALDVILYTRKGCHLCEEAWQQLEDARRRYRFTLRTQDVDTDPALRERYGEQVPVVTVNGKVRFRGGVNRILLDRLLHALTRGGDDL